MGEKRAVKKVKETQVVIYSSYFYKIGGIETFIYNFCKYFHKKYEILIVYGKMDPLQCERFIPFVEVMHNSEDVEIHCDTIINNRITDKIPENIKYKKSVQMVHCLKQKPTWIIPQNRDYIVNVSEASRRSFGEEAAKGMVINNLLYPEDVQKSLILVSAMRVGAMDKQGNDDRIRKLCNMMDDAGIYFKWLYFGDKKMAPEPKGMIYCGCTLDIQPFIKAADYVVQLSGSEAYSYTMIESLAMNVPLICTPLEQNEDMWIKDGVNAYIVPFDMEFDVRKLLEIPRFKYKLDNGPLLDKWTEILGKPKPFKQYDPNMMMKVRVIRRYFDLILQRTVECKEVLEVSCMRASKLMSMELVVKEEE